MRPNSSLARLSAIALVTLGIVALSPAQILRFLPVTDSIIVSGLNDVPPALKYSIDTSAVGIDSIRIVSAVALYASSIGVRRLIPYCTYIVRDSMRHNEYTLWLLRDPPATPGRILITAKQFTGLFPGKGYLSLVISVAGTPIDSLRVRCIVDIPNAVNNQGGQADNTRFQLMPNYPNPFNGQTAIQYFLPMTEQVSLVVYNLAGQPVRRICEGVQEFGAHTVHFDAQNLPSGIYYLRLKSPTRSSVITMTLVR